MKAIPSMTVEELIKAIDDIEEFEEQTFEKWVEIIKVVIKCGDAYWAYTPNTRKEVTNIGKLDAIRWQLMDFLSDELKRAEELGLDCWNNQAQIKEYINYASMVRLSYYMIDSGFEEDAWLHAHKDAYGKAEVYIKQESGALTHYQYLRQAMNAAAEGQTITLQNEVLLTDELELNNKNKYTINTNGKCIRMAHDPVGAEDEMKTLVVTAGTVTVTGGGFINKRGIKQEKQRNQYRH